MISRSSGNHGMRVSNGQMPKPVPGLANPGTLPSRSSSKMDEVVRDTQTFDVRYRS